MNVYRPDTRGFEQIQTIKSRELARPARSRRIADIRRGDRL